MSEYLALGVLICTLVIWAYEREGGKGDKYSPTAWFVICGSIISLWPLAVGFIAYYAVQHVEKP